MYNSYAPSPGLHHSHSSASRYSRSTPAPGGYGQQAPGYGAPYQQQQQHYGPPAGADPQLWQWFNAVDADRSGAISVNELQSALVNGTRSRGLILVNLFMNERRKLVECVMIALGSDGFSPLLQSSTLIPSRCS